METLSYEIIINAPKEKVWDVLWNENTYSEWTKFFNPKSASFMKSDWKVNGKTYFTNAEGAGMVSTIDSLEKPDQIVFKHLGMRDEAGNEDTESMEVKQWSGCFEKYFLIDFDGKTKLHAEVQTEKDWEEHMNTGFTKGLQIVKELAEK
ncbi:MULTISPECIES: SRPBCC family protein [unclassified Chryseobacterium]|uniref:SRPBCC family protein n=1 Tax=unclassified Chryseobacterium TaxID=2593645 RepID=UPI000D3AA5CA|nr:MULTISPECIES: SRPBCC domain-containing protein [unclassified Chryseobacterium]PTT71598.1 ATPase [Chryseobacterium sp. HMWF001]PVV55404.1 SRPBCC domain-containing protein [Chryseobacterium sp. HMWF035]